MSKLLKVEQVTDRFNVYIVTVHKRIRGGYDGGTFLN